MDSGRVAFRCSKEGIFFEGGVDSGRVAYGSLKKWYISGGIICDIPRGRF